MAPTVETPVGSAPIIPLIILGTGFYIAWFGIHYFGSTTTWPSTPVKAVLTGKPIPVPSGQTPAQQIQADIETANAAAGSNTNAGAGTPGASNAPAGNASANATTIYTYLRQAGWRPIQAAGAVCSMGGESSWDPEVSVIDSNGLPSQGIMQWNGSNYQTYVGAPAPTGNASADLDAQLPAIIRYTNGRATGPAALVMMSTLKSILAASQIFSTQVEGAAISDAHASIAQEVLTMVNAVEPGTGLTV